MARLDDAGLSQADHAVLETLERLRGAACRRCIESHLYFSPKPLAPTVIKGAIERLVAVELIHRTEAPVGSLHEFDTFSTTGASEFAVEQCKRRVKRGHEILAEAALGTAGENYARAILNGSKMFRLPRGKNRDRNAPYDVLAKLKLRTDVRVAIEVKNTREVYYPNARSSRLFGRLANAAINEGAFPILIVSHMSSDALADCERIGLAVIIMRRQILPNSVLRGERRILAQAFGPEPYDRIEKDRAFHHKFSDAASRDVLQLRNTALFETRFAAWSKTVRLLLSSKERVDAATLRRLVQIVEKQGGG